MISPVLDLGIVVASLIIFILLQRWLHRLFQAVLVLITRDHAVAISVFSLIFLPGVVVHELSHFLMAKILRVKTGKISLIPKVIDQNRVQLGYVEIYPTDLLRDSMIGLAPLLSGIALITIIATRFLNIPNLAELNLPESIFNFFPNIRGVISADDSFLWLYLSFTISTTMMPSESDRKALLPVILLISILLLAAFGLGFGDWITQMLANPLRQSLLLFTFILWISAILHGISIIFLLIVHFFLMKISQFSYAK
ncbi:MAG TPA: hypothetical protein VN226_01090 [Anaerolineales bacterium]|nr:hypothetical protein [Anaerolineales bacterium]